MPAFFISLQEKAMVGFNCKKAVQTLAFFAQKEGGVINKMKAFKLIVSVKVPLQIYYK